MGQRKKLAAEVRKEAMKTVAIAHLRNVPTSPRRMRQVADLIRGVEVEKALGILRFRGLKRMLPAPQGRAYRMKKRSNHVSLIVDTKA